MGCHPANYVFLVVLKTCCDVMVREVSS